ncbi:MAG: hypothetical protein JWM20_497 [Patescibacteria group bacterium]|nr:hypothetical protein [Patescibacteria group bacterium]
MAKIIGITGTLGAGKGEVVEYLTKKKGYGYFSVSGYLTEVLIERGIAVNRDNMVKIANDLRSEGTEDFIVVKMREIQASGIDTIVESIRTKKEIDYILSQEDMYMIAVNAPIKLRYERIQERKSAKDNVSFEKFQADEELEMYNDDPTKQCLSYCIGRVPDGMKICNDGTKEELYAKVDAIINLIERKERV